MIAVIDYHVGNLGSVTNALRRLDMDVEVTSDPQVILQADGVILPGVGTFPVAMKNLENEHLIEVLNEVKAKKTPIMGICLGMQVLFDKGYEVEETKGLGFLDGEVKYMDDVKAKIPHMGWNSLHLENDGRLFKGIAENSYVYFVHSYYLKAEEEQIVKASTEYTTHIHASVEKDNIFACQFHPEKSSDVGLKILKNFVEL